MNSEIIQSVVYDNYDDFQHFKLHIFTKFHFTILRIIFLKDETELKVRFSKSSNGLWQGLPGTSV
jgi:hypothetical protein